MINWLKVGWEVARMLVPLVLGALLFRRFVSPGINVALEEVTEAVSKITNVAKLAGIKSAEYRDSKALEQAVSADLIRDPSYAGLRFYDRTQTGYDMHHGRNIEREGRPDGRTQRDSLCRAISRG